MGGSLRPPYLRSFNTEVTEMLRALRVEGLIATSTRSHCFDPYSLIRGKNLSTLRRIPRLVVSSRSDSILNLAMVICADSALPRSDRRCPSPLPFTLHTFLPNFGRRRQNGP